MVRRTRDADSLGCDLAEDADRDTRANPPQRDRTQTSAHLNATELVARREGNIPGEGVAHHEVPVDAHLLAELADLVLEHFTEGLDEFELRVECEISTCFPG